MLSFGAGTTTMQAAMPSHLPVFEVSGARKLNYLRTATGDVYENGGWTQSDPVEAPYEGIEQLVEVASSARSETSSARAAGIFHLSLSDGPDYRAVGHCFASK